MKTMMDQTDRIADNVYMIGNTGIPVYLITGQRLCVLIDAGITVMGPSYVDRITSCLAHSGVPLYLFLTHSHYDHIGPIAYLKKRIPGLKVGGYRSIDGVLRSSRAVELITSLNRDIETLTGTDDPEIAFKTFRLDVLLDGGETYDTGSDTLEAIYTPGHTKDSVCYYLRQRKIMFTGEAAGIKLPTGEILPEFLSSYKAYINSLNTLAGYPVDQVAVGHGPRIEGEEARHYFKDSLRATDLFIERIRAYYRESGSVGDVVERIKREDYERSGSGQMERAYTINLEAKVKAVIEDK